MNYEDDEAELRRLKAEELSMDLSPNDIAMANSVNSSSPLVVQGEAHRTIQQLMASDVRQARIQELESRLRFREQKT